MIDKIFNEDSLHATIRHGAFSPCVDWECGGEPHLVLK